MPALDVLLAPENLLVNVVCGLAVQFVYLGLLTGVLPPRSARTFWTAELVALGLMLSGLRWLCRRFFPLDNSRNERVGRRGAAWLQRFALFPLIQVALIYSMVWIAFDVMRGDPLKHIFQIKKRQLSGASKWVVL